MAQALWGAPSHAAWQTAAAQQRSLVEACAPPALPPLNRWIEDELPGIIAGRGGGIGGQQRHITQPELVKLMEWKLSRGKWRPNLLNLVQQNSDAAVREASERALALLSSTKQQQRPDASKVEAALKALSELRGVGPATASAVLAAAEPSCPYMGDAALDAVVGSRKYSIAEYLLLLQALRSKAGELAAADPGTGWTPVLVERCLFAAELATAKATKGSKAPATKGSKGAKAAPAAAGGAARRQQGGGSSSGSKRKAAPASASSPDADEEEQAAAAGSTQQAAADKRGRR